MILRELLRVKMRSYSARVQDGEGVCSDVLASGVSGGQLGGGARANVGVWGKRKDGSANSNAIAPGGVAEMQMIRSTPLLAGSQARLINRHNRVTNRQNWMRQRHLHWAPSLRTGRHQEQC